MKSKYFYVLVEGSYALFSIPEYKSGGEKFTYTIPTREALKGIVDAIYWKPTFINVIDEVKIINEIKIENISQRLLLDNYGADLCHYTYLKDVKYLIKYHFEWSDNKEFENDRNEYKHTEIMLRSIKKGGRRDIFLGTRECIGYVRDIFDIPLIYSEYEKKQDELNNRFNSEKTFYENSNIAFGYMFEKFIYPKKKNEKLKSIYSNINIQNGIINFNLENKKIEYELSNYNFKICSKIKSVDDEYDLCV